MELVFKNLTSDKQYSSKLFEKILAAAIKELKPGKNIELSVNLVGEAKIRALNKKYRNKNKVTDVLSFPMMKSSNLETRDKKQGKTEKLVSDRLSLVADLGDIFICLPFAKKEAKSENITMEDKLARLTVHGLLHLLGYDHEKSKHDADRMDKLESRILNRLKF